MKWYYYLFFLSVLSLFSCLGQQTDDKTKEQRELLKEYFLCECITEGFDDKNIQEDDISQSVLFDILNYSPDAIQEVKEYAKSFVQTIDPSPIEDLGNRKAIILNSIEKYKSQELDDFIKSLDRYLLND
jgi:hypothetical protein